MTTVNFNCLVIRRSTNTNSFGLRGILVITENSRRVFSFAANDDAAYTVGVFARIPFHLYSNNTEACPAHELAREETRKSIPADEVPEFLGLFNDTLAETWTAYRKAKAIEGVTRIKLTDPTLTPHRLPRIWPTA
jgi:hypothetical protein